MDFSSLEPLVRVWPILLAVFVPTVVAAIIMLLLQMGKGKPRPRDLAGWTHVEARLVAGLIDARPTNLSPEDPAIDPRFVRLHFEYDDASPTLKTHSSGLVRASSLPKPVYRRFFRNRKRSVGTVNLRIEDLTERDRAERLAVTDGYLLHLRPPEPVMLYRSDSGQIQWSPAR